MRDEKDAGLFGQPTPEVRPSIIDRTLVAALLTNLSQEGLSDEDRIACLAVLGACVKDSKADWDSLLTEMPGACPECDRRRFALFSWRYKVYHLWEHCYGALTDREKEFVRKLREAPRITGKQERWLNGIFAQITRAEERQ